MVQMMYYQVVMNGFQTMLDELMLLSGNDIPFPEAKITIHQPKLKEIAYITEKRFWLGCELLKFNKENLPSKDKNSLLNWSNFDILMSMITEKNAESKEAKVNVLSLCTLLFPRNKISLKKTAIRLKDPASNEVIAEINKENFDSLQEIIN